MSCVHVMQNQPIHANVSVSKYAFDAIVFNIHTWNSLASIRLHSTIYSARLPKLPAKSTLICGCAMHCISSIYSAIRGGLSVHGWMAPQSDYFHSSGSRGFLRDSSVWGAARRLRVSNKPSDNEHTSTLWKWGRKSIESMTSFMDCSIKRCQ